eukprot:TRINITY_DN1708_c0_g1_i2.p1 TRINITY_DN1708_c0_g1~~TRINITY_DN1708_c0_g1_i2.p1  ORF type:complete len:390 (+),score=103.72 TRINITY_DN1708_c0_g1_i2:235-1404(+)
MSKFNPAAILKQIRNKKDSNSKHSDSERESYEYYPKFSNPNNNDNFSTHQTRGSPSPTFFVQNSEYLSKMNEKYDTTYNSRQENHIHTSIQTMQPQTQQQSQTPVPNLSFLNTTHIPSEPLYSLSSNSSPLPNPYSVVDMLKDQLEEKISENRHLSNLVVEAELHIKNLQDQKIALEGALRDAMLQIQSMDQRCRGLTEQRNDLLKELGNRGRDSLEKRLAEVERRVSPTPPSNYEKHAHRPISPPLRRTIQPNRTSSSLSYPPPLHSNNNINHSNSYNTHTNHSNNNNNNSNSIPLTMSDFDKRKPFISAISPHSTRFQHKQETGVIHLPKGLKESEKPVIRIDLASEIKGMYSNNNSNNNHSNQSNGNTSENGRGRPPSRTKQRPIK